MLAVTLGNSAAAPQRAARGFGAVRPAQWAVGIAGLALLARLPLILQRHDVTPGGDSAGYLSLAHGLLHDSVYGAGGDVRPPGYPLFIALLEPLPGRVEDAVIVAQHLLGVGLTAAVVIVAWTWFGRTCAIVAGLLTGLTPALMLVEGLLLADFLFGAIAFAGAAFLTGALLHPEQRGRLLALTALAFAAATYVKPVGQFLILAPPLAFALGTRAPRPTFRATVLVAGLLAAAILPWIVRNAIVHGEFAMSTQSGTTLFNRAFEVDKLPIPRDEPGGALAVAFQEANPDTRLSSGFFNELLRRGTPRREAMAIQQHLALEAFKRAPGKFATGTLRSTHGVYRGVTVGGGRESLRAAFAQQGGLLGEVGEGLTSAASSVIRPLWVLFALQGVAVFLWFFVRHPSAGVAAGAFLAVWLAISFATAVTHGGQLRYSAALAPITWILGSAGIAFAVALVNATLAGRPDRRLAIALGAVALLVAAVAVPRVAVMSSPAEVRALELNRGSSGVAARVAGDLEANADGFVVAPHGRGRLTLPVPLSATGADRLVLRVWAPARDPVAVRVVLARPGRPDQLLGVTDQWVGRRFDLGPQRDTKATLRVSVDNPTGAPALILDRVAQLNVPPGAVSRLSPALAGMLVTMLVAAGLQLAGGLRRHWLLPGLLGIAGMMWWDRVIAQASLPLDPDAQSLWTAASEAPWFSIDLPVRAFRAVVPIVGDGAAGARAASALFGLLVLGALYVLANRLGGRVAAVAAVVAAILLSGFSTAAADGTDVMVTLLGTSVFLLAVHHGLNRGGRLRLAGMAATGSLLVLCEPLCLPGVMLLLGWAVVREDRSARAGSAALVLALVAALVLPNQPFDNLTRRATQARIAERGASGRVAPITMPAYLVGSRSPELAIGSSLRGAADTVSALGRARLGGVRAALALVILLFGVAVLVGSPVSRRLAGATALIALPVLAFVGLQGTSPQVAGAVAWPMMLVGVGLVARGVLVMWSGVASRVPQETP